MISKSVFFWACRHLPCKIWNSYEFFVYYQSEDSRLNGHIHPPNHFHYLAHNMQHILSTWVDFFKTRLHLVHALRSRLNHISLKYRCPSHRYILFRQLYLKVDNSLFKCIVIIESLIFEWYVVLLWLREWIPKTNHMFKEIVCSKYDTHSRRTTRKVATASNYIVSTKQMFDVIGEVG